MENVKKVLTMDETLASIDKSVLAEFAGLKEREKIRQDAENYPIWKQVVYKAIESNKKYVLTLGNSCKANADVKKLTGYQPISLLHKIRAFKKSTGTAYAKTSTEKSTDSAFAEKYVSIMFQLETGDELRIAKR